MPKTSSPDLANLYLQPSGVQDRVLVDCESAVADAIVNDFADRSPKLAARHGIRSWQKVAMLGVAGACVVAAALAPHALLVALLLLTTPIVLASFAVAVAGLWRGSAFARRRRSVPRLAEHQLPTYTVLVPAYREEDVIGELVACLGDLDYPRDKLEVLLLVERGDVATQRAIADADPPPYMRVVPVPSGPPRTKPRSCNAGLLVARGELLVIFDAEDRPEPDQLRRAADMFAAHGGDLACVQATLSTSNVRANILTHCFGVEYALRYRLTVPGLAALGVPFPLGGTSNHFRARVLREVGGWDAWNVSEDADLGMRLRALGYRSRVVDSITYGDAPDRLGDWISQRTRWHKGFLLTALVHTREPIGALRRFGPRGLLGLVFFVLGTPLQFLAQPVILVVGLSTWAGHSGLMEPVIVDAVGLSVLQLATMLMWLLAAYLAGTKPRRRHLRAVAALPLYWCAHWVAAWRALYQLITAPFVWEKTTHRCSVARISEEP